ncbi:MAG: pyruvate formate lyase family protein, partial [Caldilineaceae bacterium]
MVDVVTVRTSWSQRMEGLRQEKLAQTKEKQEVLGSQDHDDWALILPPPEERQIVEAMSTSGMPIRDCLLASYSVTPNHPSGGFFGPAAVGENFGALLRAHPVYIDARSSLAGGYMVNFNSYRKPGWNPDYDYDYLKPLHKRYGIVPGIGGTQHFCQDLQIGLELGWDGLLKKIEYYRLENDGDSAGFYDGLEAIVRGMQDWIGRHASAARRMADEEGDPVLRANLLEMADINERLVTAAPETFREACQWILWYQIAARMYDGSGSLGRLDLILQPYYDRDVACGLLDDEEAIFHIACLLLRDTA